MGFSKKILSERKNASVTAVTATTQAGTRGHPPISHFTAVAKADMSRPED